MLYYTPIIRFIIVHFSLSLFLFIYVYNFVLFCVLFYSVYFMSLFCVCVFCVFFDPAFGCYTAINVCVLESNNKSANVRSKKSKSKFSRTAYIYTKQLSRWIATGQHQTVRHSRLQRRRADVIRTTSFGDKTHEKKQKNATDSELFDNDEANFHDDDDDDDDDDDTLAVF